MLDAVSLSLGGAAGVESKTTDARKGLNQTYDQFLSLLTTQLKNQDPLNPMDSKDFTNQLVNMANVEQSIAQTDKLNELIKLNQTSAINSTLLGYVGMNVDYKGSDFTYKGGTALQFNYSLGADATKTTANVYDKNDKLVWTGDIAANSAKGNYSFVWTGVNTDGTQAVEGDYHIEFKAVNSSGAPVEATTAVSDFTFSKAATDMALKYNLEAPAAKTIVSIFDKDKKLVWSGPGEKTAGDHTITWSGTDKDGKPVSIGNYTVEVGAQDKDGRAVKTSTTVPATVNGLEVVDGAVMLLIGNQKVPISSVNAVHLPS